MPGMAILHGFGCAPKDPNTNSVLVKVYVGE